MRAPNVHKPRFRYNRYFDHVICEETYKKWQNSNPHLKDKLNSFSSFNKYWRRIADMIIQEVCINPFGVKFPYYTGILSIKYSNIDLKPINKRASIINNKNIPHLNWNSSERTGKLVWNTGKDARFNSMIINYGFKGVRVFNQAVNKALHENPEVFRVYSANTAEGKYKLKLKIEEQIRNIEN